MAIVISATVLKSCQNWCIFFIDFNVEDRRKLPGFCHFIQFYFRKIIMQVKCKITISAVNREVTVNDEICRK